MIPLSDATKPKRFPFINLALIAINIVVFLLQLTTSDPDGFIMKYALVPSQINPADFTTWYPFITSMFLHGGFLHIASNMLFLWVFGDNVEAEFPPFVYLIMYLIAGVIGSLSQYLLHPTSDIPMLGASGAVSGVLGAYFVWFPHHKIRTLVPVFGFFTIMNISAFFMLGYWFVLQIISGAVSLPFSADQGGVAFWAHVGGFVTGIVIAKLFGSPKKAYIEGKIIYDA